GVDRRPAEPVERAGLADDDAGPHDGRHVGDDVGARRLPDGDEPDHSACGGHDCRNSIIDRGRDHAGNERVDGPPNGVIPSGMILKQGDSGPAVKALQGNLNKLGAIVLVDGGFGGETRDAITDARVALGQPGPSTEAEDALQEALAAVADPLPALSAAGVTFIARFEVSSPAGYRRSFSHPIFPGGESGVTIGIGYDLRFADEAQLRADW